MHIAVCDDNVADRKQTERLLSRESAKRLETSGNLYVDSFGNETALLAAPMKYDLFFLDMTNSTLDGAELAATLRNEGVTAPIAQCKAKEPTIEIRDSKKAHYLHSKQIIHADSAPDGVTVTCTDGLVIHPLGDIRDLFQSFTGFDTFVLIGHKTLINLEHVKEYKKRTVTLSDGASYTVSILENKSFLRALNALR